MPTRIVTDVLLPTGLSMYSLAHAIGEHPRVLLKIATGDWKMLPRVAQRLVERQKDLSSRGMVAQPTFDEWHHVEAEDVPEHLAYDKLTRLTDVELGELRDFHAWSREHQAFTLEAFQHAAGWDISHIKKARSFLHEHGFFQRRELVGDERAYVWRWNPAHYTTPHGRPPLNRPKDSTKSPTKVTQVVEKMVIKRKVVVSTSDERSATEVMGECQSITKAWLTNNRMAFTNGEFVRFVKEQMLTTAKTVEISFILPYCLEQEGWRMDPQSKIWVRSK